MLKINNYKRLEDCENIYSIDEYLRYYEITLITESWKYCYKTHTFLLNRYEIENNGNIGYELFSKKFGGSVMIDIHTVRNSTKLMDKMKEYVKMNNRNLHYL
jgi:hypothetical protein